MPTLFSPRNKKSVASVVIYRQFPPQRTYTNARDTTMAQTQPPRFTIDSAKTGRSLCRNRSCRINIEKGEMRVGELINFKGKSGSDHFGYSFYHLTEECSGFMRADVGEDIKGVGGYDSLTESQRDIVDKWCTGKLSASSTGDDDSLAESIPSDEVKWRCATCGTPSRAEPRPRILVGEFTHRCSNNNDCRKVTNIPPTARPHILQRVYFACAHKSCRTAATEELRGVMYDDCPSSVQCVHCNTALRPGVRVVEVTAESRIKLYLETHDVPYTAKPKKERQTKKKKTKNSE
jgi:hypothetical protein